MKIKINHIKKLKNLTLCYCTNLKFQELQLMTSHNMYDILYEEMKKGNWVQVSLREDAKDRILEIVKIPAVSQRRFDIISLKLRGGTVTRLSDTDKSLWDSISPSELEEYKHEKES